ELESYNYSISHDLRQPLNAISGFSELLRDTGVAGGKAGEFVHEIEHNAARMERMIEALLSFSRAGRDALNRQPVDAKALVDEALREHSVAAPITATVEIGELPAARGDAVLLRQVWSNLIGNAMKY